MWHKDVHFKELLSQRPKQLTKQCRGTSSSMSLENKIHIFAPPCNILCILHQKDSKNVNIDNLILYKIFMSKKCLKILFFFLIVGSYGLYLQGARPSRDRRNNSAIVTRYCKHHWKLFCLSYHSKEQRHEVSTGIPILSATFTVFL